MNNLYSQKTQITNKYALDYILNKYVLEGYYSKNYHRETTSFLEQRAKIN